MNMTEKNGQPSMEEILASIRRIIAEEPAQPNGELRGTPIMLKGDSGMDEAGEFDLPAIFRSSPPPQSDRTPLLGRLTDAIRSATTSHPEGRTHLNGEDHARVEAVEGGNLSAEPAPSYPGLSSLKPVRAGEPAEPVRPLSGAPSGSDSRSAPESQSGPFPTASSGGSSEPEPKRVMAPFKDTHFLRMTGSEGATPVPSPAPVTDALPAAPLPEPVPPEPEPNITGRPDFGAIIPGQLDRAALHATPQPMIAPGPREIPPTVVAMPPPPPLPAGDPGHGAPPFASSHAEGTGSIEDTTADLLRPMLRQWLADNMPRMVEKALHIEIAESVKSPKKP